MVNEKKDNNHPFYKQGEKLFYFYKFIYKKEGLCNFMW